MDDKVVEKPQDRKNENEAPEQKPRLSKFHLALMIVGAGAALFFIALTVWICIAAPPEKKKERASDDGVAATVKPAKRNGSWVITFPVLKRADRPDVAPTMTLVPVEPGSFQMGAAPRTHRAELKQLFYIGATEVTQAQWLAAMGAKPNGGGKGKEKKSYYVFKVDDEHPNGSDDLPEEMVSWNEAMAFCAWLNKGGYAPEGWMFTLPTETQWEFAARGGNKSKGFRYSGGNDLHEVAWCNGNNGLPGDRRPKDDAERRRWAVSGKNRPVAGRRPNELGLYDMNGNVFEWCLDDWRPDVAGTVPEFPRGNDASGQFRVIRGGCWYTKDSECLPSLRCPMTPGGRSHFLGFRVVLVRKPAAK